MSNRGLLIALIALNFVLLASCVLTARTMLKDDSVEFNWAIQGQDPAIEGCPGQYHQYADINNDEHILIGCWGKK